MSGTAGRGLSQKRRLLEFWRGVLKKRRCARSERATKGTGAYFESLEPRVLLSGGVEGVLVDTDSSSHQDLPQAPVAAEIAYLEEAHGTSLVDLSGLASDPDPEMQPDLMDGAGMRELAFVDENVADYERLIADLQGSDGNRTIEVVALGSDRNGIEQVSEILADRSDLTAVHFITHGAAGQINLGNAWLNSATLQQYSAMVAGWGNALTETGDILFYGCNIAAASDGQSLLDEIAHLTDADVAGSDDLTGNAQSGGDWDLEYVSGKIETDGALSSEAQQNWSGVLAAFTVNTTGDTVDANPGDGLARDALGHTSLRAAVMEANALAGADQIVLGAGTYTLSLGPSGDDAAASGDLDVTGDLTITGAGANTTFVNGGGGDRVFQILNGTVAMSGLTIQGGSCVPDDGGGVSVESGANLSLQDTALSGNAATKGGAINVYGALMLNRVIIDGNTANEGAGIYVKSGGTAALTNVTISGNTAFNKGGAIVANDTITITSSTIAGNAASSSAGGIVRQGGALIDLKNTILANNTGGNVSGVVTSLGNNIDSDGTAALAGAGDLSGVAPMLAALGFNGGPTKTHALLSGSPAINAGTAIGAPVVDQRGASRDVTPDIGAFEYGAVIVNNPGTVTIDNTTPAQGDTLTAIVNDADGISGAIAYRWYRDGVGIAGATAAGYTTAEADVGTQISVQVSYTDGHGSNESLTSVQTAAVANVNDAPVGIPSITGTVTEDQTLTANTAGISDADGLGAFSYQWLRNGGAIGGATASTYTLGDADVGTQVRVQVSYTDGHGTNESLTSVQTAAVANVNEVPTGAPVITGVATKGQTLTADGSGISDADGLGAFSYQWLRDGVAIGGASASTYTLGNADVGTQISVQVSYTDGHGSNESLTGSTVGPVVNVDAIPVGVPTISGTATEDQTITADVSGISDGDGLGVFSYQWLRDGVAVAGATNSTYTLGDADVGTRIRVQVSYTDGHGTNESLTSVQTAAVANVNDAPVGIPSITGTVTEDQTLTANTAGISDADGLGAFSYQWLRNGLAIGGATASTYTLGDADVGTRIRVQVSYTDGHGTNESLTSAQTVAVANVNEVPTGAPVFTGAATEDQTLTADGSGISDGDGLGAFSYQWLRDGVAIAGAANSTYTLGDADVGTQIRVQVSYTDGHGTAESVTSVQTAAVANVNDAPVGIPSITGTVTEDQTLTANTAGISDADGLGAFSYQWLRNGLAIGGATASSYTLGDADVGTQVRVQVSYTDGHGTNESLTSVQTAAVANVNDAPVGVPMVTGTATEDQTLTADTSGISDADGLGAFSYQWQRSTDGGSTWASIGGATASTYILGDADVGNILRVNVSYTDGQGTNESVTSAAVGPVAIVNNPGPVVIDNSVGPPPVTDVINPGPVGIDNPTDSVKPQTAPADTKPSPLPEPTEPSPNTAGKGSEQTGVPKEAASEGGVPVESNPTPNQPSEKRDVPSNPSIRTDLPSFLLPKQSLLNTETARYAQSLAVQAQDLRPEGPLVMQARDYEHLRDSLDAVKQEMTSQNMLSQVYLGSAVVSSIGLSVGYVVWLLRGGMLIASLLSSMPAWQFLDPLPILARKKDDDDSDDNESLESIVDKKPRQLNPNKKPADASSDAEVKRR